MFGRIGAPRTLFVYLVRTVGHHSDVTVGAGGVETTDFWIARVRVRPFVSAEKQKSTNRSVRMTRVRTKTECIKTRRGVSA